MKKTNTIELPLIDKFLINYATLIDNVDMYTGPFFEAKMFTESETFHQLATATRIAEYTLKIPFILTYLARTKDLNSITEWIPKEIFAISVPYGGILQIFRRYEKRVKDHYNIK
ncbi:hypothetical protein K9L97_04320 [Candidatus Woesearchaeota archaeon]|nr:hypothetical protein [Candidatus Woesearchaeota archaeon]